MQTAVEQGAGNTLLIRTFVPSTPPPGRTLPDRQVQTTLWSVGDGGGLSAAPVGAMPPAGRSERERERKHACDGEQGAAGDSGRGGDYVVQHTVRMPHLQHLQAFMRSAC